MSLSIYKPLLVLDSSDTEGDEFTVSPGRYSFVFKDVPSGSTISLELDPVGDRTWIKVQDFDADGFGDDAEGAAGVNVPLGRLRMTATSAGAQVWLTSVEGDV